MKTDTIAAIATAMTPAGIGIIRISGDEAFSVIDKIYHSKNNKKVLSNCDSHTIHYGYIYDKDELIDEVMVMIMRGPKSYTREDTIEINCHGGILVMQRILEAVIHNGARIAEPGEFTKRAFLNGRMDLSQAESVIDIIHSKNEFALKSSLEQLRGSVKQKITELRGKVIHEIAYIESALDDPEHISLDGYPDELWNKMKELTDELSSLIQSSGNGIMLKEGIRTALVGKPNAGKSSLLNVLTGKERAIVTDVAGTTRDTLEEQININGIALNIIDTAGIRDTDDIVESIGVEKSLSCMDEADLILYVVDSSISLDANDEQIIKKLQGKKYIVLLNKSDLDTVVTDEDIKRKLSADISVINISAKNENGVEQLHDMISTMFFNGEVSFNDQVIITNIRHKNYLSEAYESLMLVRKSIEDGLPEDFYSIDLMSAYESLGFIIGESIEDDLVNEIFSKFCMGK